MKNYGQLALSEQLELKDLANREMAIQNLISRLIQEQLEFDKKRDEWFQKIREKYRVNTEDVIYIDPEYWIIKDDDTE